MSHSTTSAFLAGLVGAAILVFSAGAASSAAQAEDGSPSLDLSSGWNRGFGVAADDGGLVGLGPRFKVFFEPGGPRLFPAFGQRAQVQHSLGLALASIRRGDLVVLGAAASAHPTREGNTVHYARAGGILESYEVVREGIEQSFAFPERPPGDGDLIVRVRLDGDLPPLVSPSTDGGLRFEFPGVGALRYGAVQGVDAQGWTVRGEVRFDSGAVELALPADFVDRATYPLVLDPLIGPVTEVTDGSEDQRPAVAYDQAADVFLVVFERWFTMHERDIWGQFVSRDGKVVGAPIAYSIEVGDQPSNAAVANVRSNGMFLAVWQTGTFGIDSDLVCRSLFAGLGHFSSTVPIAASSESEKFAAVGGTVEPGVDTVLVTWERDDVSIRGARVRVPQWSNPVVEASFIVSSDDRDEKVSLPRSGGPSGHYLFTWKRFYDSPAPGDHDILGRVYDKSGLPISGIVEIANDFGPNEEHQAVDGDGSRWVVAYDREEVLDSGDRDIYAVVARFDGASLFVETPQVVEADHPYDESDPAVGYTGEAYAVAWVEGGTLQDDLRAVNIDPFTCGPCEPQAWVETTSLGVREPVIATCYSGSDPGAPTLDEALIVWDAPTPGSDFSDIRAARWHTQTGGAVDLGGGCGGGGVAHATCAVLDNPGFAHRLSGAAPGVHAWLILAFDQTAITCGACTLIAHPVDAIVFDAGLTSTSGTATVTTPIPDAPGLLGLTFVDQWVVDTAPGVCSWLKADLSNAIEVEIQ